MEEAIEAEQVLSRPLQLATGMQVLLTDETHVADRASIGMKGRESAARRELKKGRAKSE